MVPLLRLETWVLEDDVSSVWGGVSLGGVGLGNPHSDVLQAAEHSNQVLRTERERQMGLCWGGAPRESRAPILGQTLAWLHI